MGILEEYRGLGGNIVMYNELNKSLHSSGGQFVHADMTQMADLVINMLVGREHVGRKPVQGASRLSQRLVGLGVAWQQSPGDVQFTIYADAQHDSWTRTYENPELYEWFCPRQVVIGYKPGAVRAGLLIHGSRREPVP